MNLYKIIVQHFAYKDEHTSIEKYIIAKNESEVFDLIFERPTYWDCKSIDEMYSDLPNKYLEDVELGDEAHTYFEEEEGIIMEAWKKYVISTKGEYNAEWADYDGSALGTKHYGWELVQENILPAEIETLKKLKIVE